jgi:hypothetical protein
MARVKTRFVVRRGRIGRPLSLSLNLSGRGAKIDRVPVPVLRCLRFQTRIVSSIDLDIDLPVWSSFTKVQNLTDKIEVLMLLV